jgi:hypothetical protein
VFCESQQGQAPRWERRAVPFAPDGEVAERHETPRRDLREAIRGVQNSKRSGAAQRDKGPVRLGLSRSQIDFRQKPLARERRILSDLDGGLEEPAGLFVERETEPRRIADRPEDPGRILDKRKRMKDSDLPAPEIQMPPDGVHQLAKRFG